MAGWYAPINGGPEVWQLTQELNKIDEYIRNLISEELGHSREQITVNYLGR